MREEISRGAGICHILDRVILRVVGHVGQHVATGPVLMVSALLAPVHMLTREGKACLRIHAAPLAKDITVMALLAPWHAVARNMQVPT